MTARRPVPALVTRAVAALLRTRWFVRSPIALYRRGLGRWLGDRLLMLEHRGRRSGLVRRVVLEVVERPSPGRFVVVSGTGERADWLRNVRAHPGVRVSSGALRSVPATARELPHEDAVAVLARYAEAHPVAWSVLSSAMSEGLGTAQDLLPVVAIDLADGGGAEAPARPQ